MASTHKMVIKYSSLLLALLLGLSSCSLIDQTETKKYSLVFGVNDYSPRGLNSLRGPVNDAQAIHNVLETNGFTSSLFTDSAASRPEIEEQITLLAPELQPGDLLLLYYAGHGIQTTIGNEANEFLIPFLPSTPGVTGIQRGDVISPADLAEMISDLHNIHVVLIFDSCNSGGFIGDSNEVVNPLPRNFSPHLKFKKGSGIISPMFTAVQRFLLSDNNNTHPLSSLPLVQGISAAGPSEESWEINSQGVFTSALVNGLTSRDADTNRDNRITLDEIYGYTFRSISRDWNQTYEMDYNQDLAFLPHRSGNAMDLVLLSY